MREHEIAFAIILTLYMFITIRIMTYPIVSENNESDCSEDIEYVVHNEVNPNWVTIESDDDISPFYNTKTIFAKVTAYAPHDNKSGICVENAAHPVTSRGLEPGYRYAAADPNKIPYGTKLIVPGYGIVEIQDTGGALRESEAYAIDVYFPTYEEAIMWGVQYLEIEVIE